MQPELRLRGTPGTPAWVGELRRLRLCRLRAVSVLLHRLSAGKSLRPGSALLRLCGVRETLPAAGRLQSALLWSGRLQSAVLRTGRLQEALLCAGLLRNLLRSRLLLQPPMQGARGAVQHQRPVPVQGMLL